MNNNICGAIGPKRLREILTAKQIPYQKTECTEDKPKIYNSKRQLCKALNVFAPGATAMQYGSIKEIKYGKKNAGKKNTSGYNEIPKGTLIPTIEGSLQFKCDLKKVDLCLFLDRPFFPIFTNAKFEADADEWAAKLQTVNPHVTIVVEDVVRANTLDQLRSYRARTVPVIIFFGRPVSNIYVDELNRVLMENGIILIHEYDGDRMDNWMYDLANTVRVIYTLKGIPTNALTVKTTVYDKSPVTISSTVKNWKTDDWMGRLELDDEFIKEPPTRVIKFKGTPPFRYKPPNFPTTRDAECDPKTRTANIKAIAKLPEDRIVTVDEATAKHNVDASDLKFLGDLTRSFKLTKGGGVEKSIRAVFDACKKYVKPKPGESDLNIESELNIDRTIMFTRWLILSINVFRHKYTANYVNIIREARAAVHNHMGDFNIDINWKYVEWVIENEHWVDKLDTKWMGVDKGVAVREIVTYLLSEKEYANHITEEDAKKYRDINNYKVFCIPIPEQNVRIADLHTLNGNGEDKTFWYNNKIINTHMDILRKRYPQHMFMTADLISVPASGKPRIADPPNWPVTLPNEIFIPVNKNDNHWQLIHIRKNTIILYDSYYQDPYPSVPSEFTTMLHTTRPDRFPKNMKISRPAPVDIIYQQDIKSCGVIVIATAHRLAARLPMYSADDITDGVPYISYEMAAQLRLELAKRIYDYSHHKDTQPVNDDLIHRDNDGSTTTTDQLTETSPKKLHNDPQTPPPNPPTWAQHPDDGVLYTMQGIWSPPPTPPPNHVFSPDSDDDDDLSKIFGIPEDTHDILKV